jgi:hypothetical protein
MPDLPLSQRDYDQAVRDAQRAARPQQPPFDWRQAINPLSILEGRGGVPYLLDRAIRYFDPNRVLYPGERLADYRRQRAEQQYISQQVEQIFNQMREKDAGVRQQDDIGQLIQRLQGSPATEVR